MVLIGIGANLSSPRFGPPLAACAAAVEALAASGLTIVGRSRWYSSLPVPPSAQPPYVNGVVRVATAEDPAVLLRRLHRLEAGFGRRRRRRDEARVLDLDLLAYGERVSSAASEVVLPHPRMHQRAFVLKPLAELAPAWRHPVLGLTVGELLAALPPGQSAEPIEP